MTQGARSTEFWSSLAAFIFGAALAVAGVVLARDVAVASGAFVVASVSVGYAHSRGKTKAPRPHLPPAGRI